MGGTYASLALILAASAAAGQGAFAACGRREWTWLSPAVGLGLLAGVCWLTLFYFDEQAVAVASAAGLAVAGLAVCVHGRVQPPTEGWGTGLVVAFAAIALASLPFAVEGHMGILGTSLNPDMSQHLFAADRLALSGGGGEERLDAQGYPLGPHALVVAVSGLGPSLVQAFSGLTAAIAVAAALAPLQVLGSLAPTRRVIAALLVGLAYMASSYLIQGAFKETLQALLVLAFAIGLHELAGGRLGGAAPAARWRLLGAVPLAALAVGSVYAYSFPGLAWLAGALGIWAAAEVIATRGITSIRPLLLPTVVATGFGLTAVLLEIPRMIDFASFETFDPDGAGLGNLFNPISPLEALGIWPSGDFRLDPGAGFAPAAAFWLGGLVAV